MKRLHIYSKLFVVIGLIISSCTTSKKEEIVPIKTEEKVSYTSISKAQFENSNMELGTIALQTFSEGIVTNGFIDVPPASKAKVSAIMAGFIKESPLLIGDKVKKGQLLLTIENPDFIEIQQNYLEVFEKLKYLKSEYERQKILLDEQITSQKNYLKAESDYKSGVAQVNSLEQKLRLMNIGISNVKAGKFTSIIPIYAPISGSITQVNASVGKFMNASDVILEVINSDHKHLELVVFEKDVLNVKEGQLIKFQIPENSLKIYNAKVHLIGKSIDEIKRTVKVHGHLEDESEPFLVGMFVESEIIIESKEKLALPISSLLEEGGNYFVLVLNSTTEDAYNFEKIAIKIGLKNENWVEIIDNDNLFSDKQILIKGAFTPLEDG
ncbi:MULTISPECIES: efflux RND transporter periplasmic adaptor subunit [Flavobacteriaceae]|uniref:Efflux RND transporter periplasmic adaptor subunit n=2 Tax=Flavobacteriaceae TaxID=49546 RepID=A0A4Y8AXU1_9FLAO|nr:MULTISPECIES: efflux RND transporter periplasmic adaptor subunit [Flavobacteriaceae]TEW76814.1 efflux RND transporter periplasmic adaptor subunit [Gramella jeungdoensis]GGK49769.1 cation efflux system protein [Lutibacter litoralis]